MNRNQYYQLIKGEAEEVMNVRLKNELSQDQKFLPLPDSMEGIAVWGPGKILIRSYYC
jgi:hypothetical protein